MRFKRVIGFAAGAVMLMSVPAMAGQGIVKSITEGCKKEINTYCKDVTPGQGRLLACFYAHGDKLSTRCEYALYDASARLERFVAAMNYLANECRGDLRQLCMGVKQGNGRLLKCLMNNKDHLSERCSSAMKDVSGKFE